MTDKTLSFQEFRERDYSGISRYAKYFYGFYSWFIENDNPLTIQGRNLTQYKMLEEKHPELAKKLTTLVTNVTRLDKRKPDDSLLDALGLLENELYEAYVKMRELGFSNNELRL